VPPTGIVIVTHNSAAQIGPCLDAIASVCGGDDQVLVIDNHSSDGTAGIVRRYENVSLIENSANLGFACAVNQGFRHFATSTGQVLLLNPDVILRTGIAALAEACQQSGLATGRLTDSAGVAQTGFSVRRFPTPAALVFETLGLNRLFANNPINRSYRYLDFDYTKASVVDQPAGAMLMVRSDVWTSMSGFDEDYYPIWFEDVDFCFRASLRGYRATYIPTVEGVHEGGHSVTQVPELHRRVYWYASLLRYSRKHFRGLGQRFVGGGVCIAGLARGASAAGTDATDTWMTVARLGFVHFVSGRKSVGQVMYSPVQQQQHKNDDDDRETTADAAAQRRGQGGVVDSSEIKNTERSLKRLHAR
jgi:N-acetylglucosaminyl-diphospho-decaprenol L-rhamnosyltransferase